MIKSTYNIMKKDDINVESLISHYLQKERKPFCPFTNFYPNVLVREFSAHRDLITDIKKIEEPFCFVTSSKDKKFKIWNFKCECLGEVNTMPSLNTIEEDIELEWKFKVDLEKLKEQEYEEVVRIFDNVGGDPPKYDPLLHGDDVQMDDVKPVVKAETRRIAKNETNTRRKRYKPLEIQNTKKDENENEDAEFKYDVKK